MFKLNSTSDVNKLQVAAGTSRESLQGLIARDHPAYLSNPYRPLSTLSHAHEATKGEYSGTKGGAGSFMPVPQKKNYLGCSVICGGVRACASSLKVVTHLERDTAISDKDQAREKENERGDGKRDVC